MTSSPELPPAATALPGPSPLGAEALAASLGEGTDGGASPQELPLGAGSRRDEAGGGQWGGLFGLESVAVESHGKYFGKIVLPRAS